MKSPNYANAPAHDERMNFKLPADLKAKVFQVAAHQRISSSQLIREAVTSYTASQNAA